MNTLLKTGLVTRIEAFCEIISQKLKINEHRIKHV